MSKSVSTLRAARAPAPSRYDVFLRRLRAGGRSNMYGAIPYLMARFDLDRDTAFRVVCDWVDRQTQPANQSDPTVLSVAAGQRPRSRTPPLVSSPGSRRRTTG